MTLGPSWWETTAFSAPPEQVYTRQKGFFDIHHTYIHTKGLLPTAVGKAPTSRMYILGGNCEGAEEYSRFVQTFRSEHPRYVRQLPPLGFTHPFNLSSCRFCARCHIFIFLRPTLTHWTESIWFPDPKDKECRQVMGVLRVFCVIDLVNQVQFSKTVFPEYKHGLERKVWRESKSAEVCFCFHGWWCILTWLVLCRYA